MTTNQQDGTTPDPESEREERPAEETAPRERDVAERGGDHLGHGGAGEGAGPDVPGEQRGPLLEQNEASVDDKVSGIVEQTRADVGGGSLDEVVVVLRERFSDAKIELSASEIERLARQVLGTN